ncbi:hypothetical protein P7M41_26640, partial [Vibrio parahaemolyticus]|nr:hypothetical protein [Vibrio parahaemolyticus]
ASANSNVSKVNTAVSEVIAEIATWSHSEVVKIRRLSGDFQCQTLTKKALHTNPANVAKNSAEF